MPAGVDDVVASPACLAPACFDALSWDETTVSAQGCLTVAKNPAARTLVWWYGAPADADPTDPKILRACNPASWINVSDLQQQLRDAGLSESTVQKLERSEVLPNYKTLRKLAAVLGHDVFDVEFTDVNRRFRGKQSTQEGEEK